jgi:hypothetical protein
MAGATDGRKNLHKIQRAIVINVLNRIVEQESLQLTPRTRKMERQQESKSRRPTLTATKQELWVLAVADRKVQGSMLAKTSRND